MQRSQVPFFDLRTQYQTIKIEIEKAISRVLDSSQFVLGSEVAHFEEEFARYCRTNHCIALNSGTSALHAALLAAGVGLGDEVITVSFTFAASVAAILYTGATPVLVDIDPATFNMDPAAIGRAITPRTKAILPVHLYGQTADMDPILEIARNQNLLVIEDAAQAHGATYNGQPAGSIGDMGCFSFYPTKNLGAYGEGGAVTTSNLQYAEKVRILRDWGQDRKYHHVLRGFNYRMEGIQGAVLRVKLRHLEDWIRTRRTLAYAYTEQLENAGVVLPARMPRTEHAYHLYTVRAKDRDSLKRALESEGIQTAVHYAQPVHLQPAYADLGYGPGSLPESERAAREVLSLPMYPELGDEQVRIVGQALRSVLAA